MLLQVSHLLPLFPSSLNIPSHLHSPSLSWCPWVIHISSLGSIFPKLFLTSPCLFSTYHLWYLFPVPFPSFSPSHSPTDNIPCDLHFSDSFPVLVVCLVFVFLFLGSVVDSCVCCHFTVHIFDLLHFYISPFNISYNEGLVMMNFFNLTLSEKHFICPSILNDSFAGWSNLRC